MIDGSDLTILVFCYNEENTIVRTLNSIRDLKLTGHTVLVSNNHSTDSTAEKINQALTRGIKFEPICPQIHLEMSEHFNWVFSQVKTRYAFPIQGHHMVLPDGLRSLLDIMHRSDDLALAFGCMYFWKGGQIYPSFYFHREGKIEGSELLYKMLFSNLVEFTTVIYDVKKVLGVGAFEKQYHRTNNWQMNIKLAARYPFYYLPHYISIWSSLSDNEKGRKKAEVARIEVPIMIHDMIKRLDFSSCDEIRIRKRYEALKDRMNAPRSAWSILVSKAKQRIKPYLMHVHGPSRRKVKELIAQWS